MTVMELLAKAELFQDLSEGVLKSVADLAQARSLEEGDAVYDLGDDADDLFLLCSGRVRFTLGVGNRPDTAGSIMTPISVLGWAALLDEQPRRVATAVCLEDSELYVISGRSLLELFERDQASGYQVMRRLATMITQDFMSGHSV